MSALVFRCDPAGIVTEVLRAGSEAEASLAGRPLAVLLRSARPSQARQLLERLRRERVVAGLELVVGSHAVSRSLVAAAAQDGEAFLVIAAETEEGLCELSATLPPGPAAARIARVLARAPADETPLAQLRRLHGELERTERELAQRYAKLERDSRDKDRILGMAAHDLRGPLSAIRASVEFLEQNLADRLGEEERGVLVRIRRSADAMALLAHELVDMTSLGEGRPRIARAPVELLPVLSGAALLHRQLAGGAGVRVELAVEGELPLLHADSARLARVLENLLSNAVDHTPSGGRVVVRARHRAPSVEIEVEDEGAGIDPAAFPQLFRPFAPRAGERHRGESHGLGLAIARALVEAHGGSIEAENVPGSGALFRVTLPTGDEHDHADPVAARREAR